MKLAIAILNWNGVKLLEEFLPSVVENSNLPGVEIWVIDNASTDDSMIFLQEKFPMVKTVQNEKNYGFTKGYNEGLKQINADIYCLLNNDIQVTANWLSPILELFKVDPKISAIQPKILDYKHRDHFEYAGAGGGFLDDLGYPYCRGRIFWTLEKDKGQYNDVHKIFWASGACMFIRSQDFWDQKGFDESFFAHMEEIDLCWRLFNSEKEIYYCGNSTVFHLGGGTLNTNNPQKTYLNFRNSLFMLTKNLPQHKLLPVIFSRLILDGITALVFWRYEGFKHLQAIFRAHMSFYKRLPTLLKERRKQKRHFFLHRFVPFQYFILGRKTFPQLKWKQKT